MVLDNSTTGNREPLVQTRENRLNSPAFRETQDFAHKKELVARIRLMYTAAVRMSLNDALASQGGADAVFKAIPLGGFESAEEMEEFFVMKASRLFTRVAVEKVLRDQEFEVSKPELDKYVEILVHTAVGSHGRTVREFNKVDEA